MAKKPATLWAFDAETDPFKHSREPQPFAWCAISEEGERAIFWGDNSTKRMQQFILEQENALFIGHNAGKFDTLFLKEIIKGEMLIVDGRILKCSPKKGVEIRDSFAILPVALAKMKTSHGKKKEIDYSKMERENREKHKREILEYLIQDCLVLLEAITDFYNRAGRRRLTLASQASYELRQAYPDLPKLSESHHREFVQFFFGGRVQCFQQGILRGNFRLLDINSSYPASMAFDFHPFGDAYKICDYRARKIPEHGAGFFVGTCDSAGAFPVRQQNKSTPYLVRNNVDVRITIHELKAAIITGAAKNFRGKLIIPENYTTFDKFILPHFESRKKAKAIGDDGGDLYHKLLPNNGYGRFAMSPEGRAESYFAEHGEDIEPLKSEGWKICGVDLASERILLERPVQKPWLFFEDVATGASITGASRARLLYGLADSINPLYCDTDGIQNEGIRGKYIKVGAELGEWKPELDFDCAAIAGKKLYSLYKDGECVKTASKGVRASPEQIWAAAMGEEVEVANDAPTMRMMGTKFITRKIKRT